MKYYTAKDLAHFERDELGYLIYPTGDYTKIKSFEDSCSFGYGSRFCDGCTFGAFCSFGEGCRFGHQCSFGRGCSFSNSSNFGMECKFGMSCSFGEGCIFSGGCSFDKNCTFGINCLFMDSCAFDTYCTFGDFCRFTNCVLKNINERIKRFIKIGDSRSRKYFAYFFKTESEIYVQHGCFFGTIKEFEEAVREEYADNEQFSTEYLEAIKYIQKIM